MPLITDEERNEMTTSFERLLSRYWTEREVREAMASDNGFNQKLWKQMAELGILGLIVDSEYGGIGGGAKEIEALMEAAGAKLLSSPFLISSIFSASLISFVADQKTKEDLLTKLCSGDMIASVAYTSDQGLWNRADIDVNATTDKDHYSLSGHASFIPYGSSADKLIVLATNGNKQEAFIISPDADGVSLSNLPTNDPTLRLARLTLNNVKAELLEGIGETEIDHALDLTLIGLAGEQAGAAREIFNITITYLKDRYQFGRQIGSFQAVKHMAADMLIEVESAVSAAREAANAFADRADSADQFVSLAAFACADAFRDVSAEAIQLHGGIAYTWEHVAHLYWRRARTGVWLFGDSNSHRENYLSILESAQ